MHEYADGRYETHPTHGPATSIRVVEITAGQVQLQESCSSRAGKPQYTFHVGDFFSVNTMVRRISA